jgi:hypothetical protein
MFDAKKARENANKSISYNMKDLLSRIEEESKKGETSCIFYEFLSGKDKKRLEELGFTVENTSDHYCSEDRWEVYW